MSHPVRTGVAPLLAAVAVGLGATPARAEQALLSITASPAALEVCPSEGEGSDSADPSGSAGSAAERPRRTMGRSMLVVRNGGSAPVKNVCLTAFTNGLAELVRSPFPLQRPGTSEDANEGSCSGLLIPELAAAEAFWTAVDVKLPGPAAATAPIQFNASYELASSGKPARTVTTGTLDVKPVAGFGANALQVEAKVVSAVLHDTQKTRVTVLITNGGTEPLELTIEPVGPKWATLEVDGPAPRIVEPQSSVSVAYELTANERVEPRKHTGMFSVVAKGSCGRILRRVATYDITYGVYGESAILTTLGVPSLLVLPGFLLLSTWMFLSRLETTRIGWLLERNTTDFRVSAKDPEFWLLGITISLVFYAVGFSPLGYGRPYGLADLAEVWAKSIGIGLVLYLGLLAAWRVWVGRTTLRSGDSVVATLKRMVNNGWDEIPRDVVDVNGSIGFRVGRVRTDPSLWWVVPPIRCSVTKLPNQEEDPHEATSIRELLARLERIASQGGTVGWASQPELSGPRALSEDGMGVGDQARALVVIEHEEK